MDEPNNFRDVSMFMLAFERGLVRTPWRRKVAKHILELEARVQFLEQEAAKKKTKPKSSDDSK